MCNFGQLTGEKSLVPKRSEISRNLAVLSMDVIKFAILKFESSRPSQPVRSPWAISAPVSVQELSNEAMYGRERNPAGVAVPRCSKF